MNTDNEKDIYYNINIFKWEIKILSLRKIQKKYHALQKELMLLKDKFLFLEHEFENKEIRLKELEHYTQEQKNQLDRMSNSGQSLAKERDYLQKETIELKEQNFKLEQLVCQKQNYTINRGCTGWIEYWKQFQYCHYNDINKKIKVLKRNIDDISQKTIDLLLERNFSLFPIQKYTDYFLYNYEYIYESWEKEGIQEGLPENEIRERFHINPDVYLEIPVFKFHCGLKLLPNHILERIKGTDIIDGGAFWGDSALIFHEYHPRSIHAFEPMPENYEQLCMIKEKNALDNLYPVNMGLGNEIKEKTIYFHEMLSGASLFNYKAIFDECSEEHTNQISITTIDDYVEKKHLKAGVIKLDVEGSELETIMGAIETICRDKPILLISVYHLPKDLFEIKPLLEELNLGYTFMFRKLVFHDPLTEVSLIGYVP